ncbi:MAG: DUF6516 family protein [Desulfuromonadales bacterium]
MKARLLQKSKEELTGGIIVETAVWELAEPTPDRPHNLKYRLYCGRNDECIVRYDNETGKGDHRHYGTREEAYCYTTFTKLAEDFLADVEHLTGVKL